MSQIEVEGNIIGSAPLVGPILQRLLIGGDQVGNLTLTHLYFLHVGLLPLLVLLLLAVHIWQIYRHGLASTGSRPTLDLAIPYWPYQTVRNMTVLAIVLGTVCSLAWAYGAPLDAPADPQISHTPRPEWYFLFLFELRRYFTGHWEFVATTLIPILVLLFLIVLPLVDRMCSRRVSAVLRFAVVLIGCGSWAALTVASVVRDRDDQELAASNTVLHELSVRARTLADHQSIPLEGPAALLRNDPKTQGPRLFSRHCASCHSFLDGEGHGIAAETPSAPNLYGFASREWISGLLDPDRIAGEHYFGNTAFAEGDMVSTIRAAFDSAADEDERDEILQDMRKAAVALSAEASLPRQNETDRRDTESIHQGRQLVSTTLGCTDCHRFREQGELGSAPDLTGYGSRDWLVSFIGNPSHARFYADRNDRMPLFAPNSEHPKKNLLPSRDVELLADWLRQDWYERDGTSENAAAPNPTSAPARRERQLADRD